MSKRSSVASSGANGAMAKPNFNSNQPGMLQWTAALPTSLPLRTETHSPANQLLAPCEAIDKQKTLLSADVGHFSLVRAMHLADLITLMNGMYYAISQPSCNCDANVSSVSRLLVDNRVV